MEQQEQTTENSRENYSVIWITLAVSKSREHLPKLLWGAFAGDKPPSNGSPGSLGSSLQTVCHGTERINNPHFHFLFMALITDDKTYSKWRKEGKKLASPVCLWDSLLGNERELKLWRICKCVYGVGGGWTDINRLAWRRAGRGPAHSAVSVRSSLPILMRYFEGLSSGLHWGAPWGQMVRCSWMGDGRTRRKPVAAGRDGWSASLHIPGWQMVKQPQWTEGMTWNFFKVAHRKPQHISCEPSWPVMSAFCVQEYLIMEITDIQVALYEALDNTGLIHRILWKHSLHYSQ